MGPNTVRKTKADQIRFRSPLEDVMRTRWLSAIVVLACLSTAEGGKSWKLVLEPARSKPPLEHYGADPAVAFGRNGAAYFGLLVGAKPTDIARSVVLRSSDGGMAWGGPVDVHRRTLMDRMYLA